jgi:predicted membrane channel-forming protein YqfA (hemolysin III family)
MSEELQAKLMAWIENLGNIASEQLPDFAQQIVAYTMWNSYIWMWFGIIGLILFGFLFVLFTTVCIIDKKEREDLSKIMFWIAVFALIPCSICISNYSKIKKCEVAPKLIIIDYIRNK